MVGNPVVKSCRGPQIIPAKPAVQRRWTRHVESGGRRWIVDGFLRERVVTGVVHILLVGAVVAVVWLLARVSDVLIMLLVAAIMATAVGPLVDFVGKARIAQQRRFPRAFVVITLYVGLTAAGLVLLTVLLMPLLGEAARMAAAVPGYAQLLREWAVALPGRYPWLSGAAIPLNRVIEEIGAITPPLVDRALGAVFRLTGGLATAVTVWVLSLYMVLESERLKRGLLALWPPGWQPAVEEVLTGLGRRFGAWVRAQLFLMLVMGVISAAGLSLLGVPYALLLGTLAGLGEIVPILGPVLAAVPAMLVAAIESPYRALGVGVFYLALQQVEGNWLVPKVMREALGLSPLVTITGLLVGGKLGGIGGMILAMPVVAGIHAVATVLLAKFRPEPPTPGRVGPPAGP
jgi:predicted PurR-regulated permease PerM